MAQSMLIQKLQAQLNRTRLSSDDFVEASKYISKISEVANDDVLKRALLVAAIVCYARPFTNNQNTPTEQATSKLSGNPEKLFKVEELVLHEKIRSLRNEAVAHIEYDRKPVKRLEGTDSGFIMSNKPFDLLSESIDLVLFDEMCRALKGDCVKKMFKLNDKILAEEKKSNSLP